MFSSNSLRKYRKVDKEKGSILRYIRYSSEAESKTNKMSSIVNEPKGETLLPTHSKFYYIEAPSKLEENGVSNGIIDPKVEGINIDAVLATNGNTDSDELDSIVGSSEEIPLCKNSAIKRLRIESDDEDDSSAPPPKKTNQEDDDLQEKLLDTYCGIYTLLDKMEIYDVMQKWKGNLAEATKNLDTLERERKARQIPLKASKQKQNLKAEREKKKQAWKIKGKMNHEFEEIEEEEDYIKKVNVYESDSSEDEEELSAVVASSSTTSARNSVIQFYNEATLHELSVVPGCSKKKAEVIIQCRPFSDWNDIVLKFKDERFITTDLLNSAKDVLYMQDMVKKLMRNCEAISSEMHSTVSEIIEEKNDGISAQPSLLNPELKMKPYQLIGVKWLELMHQQDLNAVLADEMGLGKTIQSIAFLAHLKETEEPDRLCLVVVPSSTIDNWARELQKWCPSLGVLTYHGTQDERRGMRIDIVNEKIDDNLDLILTTYNMVTTSSEDRVLFRKMVFHTVIFDEAHMLKNMASQRYENLMRIKAIRRILLTGTPLQNNLVELMSILIFVMPKLFQGKQEELKKVFSMFPKTENNENKGRYEKERIQEARRIMKPFFLRRLKADVLKDLPSKSEVINVLSLAPRQKDIYDETVKSLSEKAQEMQEQLKEVELQELDEIIELEQCNGNKNIKKKSKMYHDSSANMVMTLRKLANHPLLIRNLYTNEKIDEMAKILKKTSHRQSQIDYIIEDLQWMSDFEIHKTCDVFKSIKKYELTSDQIVQSGKFKKLDDMLPNMKKNGDKLLIFSQFVIMLDILEEYLKIRRYDYYRLDGRTQVADRQEKIDSYNEDENAFIFLLSTRAGGLGINLSSANKVIIHDIDFNPYNDRQAEDRCHRVGQTRNVTIHRFISEGTIEEGMYHCASQKLELEREITTESGETSEGGKNVLTLLKTALGLSK